MEDNRPTVKPLVGHVYETREGGTEEIGTYPNFSSGFPYKTISGLTYDAKGNYLANRQSSNDLVKDITPTVPAIDGHLYELRDGSMSRIRYDRLLQEWPYVVITHDNWVDPEGRGALGHKEPRPYDLVKNLTIAGTEAAKPPAAARENLSIPEVKAPDLLKVHYEEPKVRLIESIEVQRSISRNIVVTSSVSDAVLFNKESGSKSHEYCLSIPEVDAFCEALQLMKKQVLMTKGN